MARIGWSDGTLDSGETKQIIDDWFVDCPRMSSIDHVHRVKSIPAAQHSQARVDIARTMLDHEKLEAYHRSLDLLDLAGQIQDALPPGRAHLKDQLDRAATSVVLNIPRVLASSARTRSSASIASLAARPMRSRRSSTSSSAETW
jgi:hypothetical protein